MNYRSLHDLSRLSTVCAGSVPNDVELVVGIPRSGMLPASIIALKLNIPLTDVASFLRNDELKKGSTRTYKNDHLVRAWDARKILLVDDSISSGNSMREAVDQIREAYAGTVVTLAAFAEKHNRDMVDVHFELVEQPRMFEWNIMHHPFLSQACVEIDGVLCVGPTREDQESESRYQSYLTDAAPLFVPSGEVGHLVTGRPEKYRAETEAWLERHDVRYGELHMMGSAPSRDGRRRHHVEAKFKARIFAKLPLTRFFIEAQKQQAVEILSLTNRPVYCIETNEMYTPSKLALLKANAARTTALVRAKGWSKLKAALLKRLAISPPTKV